MFSYCYCFKQLPYQFLYRLAYFCPLKGPFKNFRRALHHNKLTYWQDQVTSREKKKASNKQKTQHDTGQVRNFLLSRAQKSLRVKTHWSPVCFLIAAWGSILCTYQFNKSPTDKHSTCSQQFLVINTVVIKILYIYIFCSLSQLQLQVRRFTASQRLFFK